jgi:hypothetical protein
MNSIGQAFILIPTTHSMRFDDHISKYTENSNTFPLTTDVVPVVAGEKSRNHRL